MKNIDYENLFIYMSLIFAICIFIFLLYSCAFSSKSQTLENFAEKSENEMKSKIVPLLEHFKDSTTTQEQKEELDNMIGKINSEVKINISELVSIIDRLKSLIPPDTNEPNIDTISTMPSYNKSNDIIKPDKPEDKPEDKLEDNPDSI
jgi:uncharacterized membrane protein YvbJ